VRRAALCVVFVLVAACARVPPRLQGVYALTTVTDAQQPGTVGERVRWGGEIVSTTPATGDTCFEIVSKPLNRDARPVPADESAGRFVACAPGFFDPTIYAPGREVTVVGTVEPPTPGKVGDADYSFSRVHTDTVFLWPQRPPRDLAYAGPYWGWGPYPYGWGWGWGGPWWGWGGGGVFVGRRVTVGHR